MCAAKAVYVVNIADQIIEVFNAGINGVGAYLFVFYDQYDIAAIFIHYKAIVESVIVNLLYFTINSS